MDREQIQEELFILIRQSLSAKGLELTDLLYRREGKGFVLRILVDRPEGGIRLGECAALNMEIGRILDESNLIQDKYLLEVSSPGLDRPLTTESDFRRCLNKEVTLYLKQKIKDKLEHTGTIIGVGQNKLQLKISNEPVEIALALINKAKQVISK